MLLSPEIQLDTPRNGAQQQHLQSQGWTAKTGRITSLGTMAIACWGLPLSDGNDRAGLANPPVQYQLLGMVPGLQDL